MNASPLRGFVSIAVVLILAALVAVGGYLYLAHTGAVPSLTLSQTATSTPAIVETASSSASVSTPENWKIFENTKYHYTVALPPAYSRQGCHPGGADDDLEWRCFISNEAGTGTKGYKEIDIIVFPKGVNDGYNHFSLIANGKAGDVVSVNGVAWSHMSTVDPTFLDSHETAYKAVYGENVYVIDMNGESNPKSILSTFKFQPPIITSPRPNQMVGLSFTLAGNIPQSWLTQSKIWVKVSDSEGEKTSWLLTVPPSKDSSADFRTEFALSGMTEDTQICFGSATLTVSSSDGDPAHSYSIPIVCGPEMSSPATHH